ncbi:hypothetical protein ACG5V6_01950 [Streptomyces chitinivorans]|uniref:Uncharacterized protein n=1 Tax=Streptomyces chitinivorans TaxID=1257027 RepID=A0ABW7HML2_9ACTN|nr:hypothetical protein [Streptomyces chitinivorans]MDH2410837.1 hypothetical protein [Streptomyces chitinivorans]
MSTIPNPPDFAQPVEAVPVTVSITMDLDDPVIYVVPCGQCQQLIAVDHFTLGHEALCRCGGMTPVAWRDPREDWAESLSAALSGRSGGVER